MLPAENELVRQAASFAIAAHSEQRRIHGWEIPFIVHPFDVATLVAEFGGTPEEIATAWLHDTVEDTSVTLTDIEREFGQEIATNVSWLTDPPEFSDLPLVERKSKQAERMLAVTSSSVRLVKVADQTSNVRQVITLGSPSWDIRKRSDYCEGAFKIVDACCLDPRLAGLIGYFDQVYSRAMKLYLISI